MYISILKCGPGLLFIGLRWPSVQVEFDIPVLGHNPIQSIGSQLTFLRNMFKIMQKNVLQHHFYKSSHLSVSNINSSNDYENKKRQ
jgi:hypothetical protein